AEAEEFAREHLISSEGSYVLQSLNFRHLAGKQDKYLYALFDVQDDHVIYRSKNSLRLDRSDHLQIVIGDKKGQRKYLVTARKQGWVNGFLMPDVPIKFPVSEQRIQGVWRQTDNGYILEIRIPLELLGNKLAFTVADVDDITSRNIKALIGKYCPENSSEICEISFIGVGYVGITPQPVASLFRQILSRSSAD
ncbi:MAG: hypothetical protein D3910_00390, partial [Candidatus Electrothrix sp. ATG2]|nr:hypothetical protein [Candidatus Electrothrix sp. ATG2]